MIQAPDPVWKRLGLSEPPDEHAGEGIGVLVIDPIGYHPALLHLQGRLRHVIIDKNMQLTVEDPFIHRERQVSLWEHGLKSLLCMAHAPFAYDSVEYTSLLPRADYTCLSYQYGSRDSLRKGIDWVLERKNEFNIKLVLCGSLWRSLHSLWWGISTSHRKKARCPSA